MNKNNALALQGSHTSDAGRRRAPLSWIANELGVLGNDCASALSAVCKVCVPVIFATQGNEKTSMALRTLLCVPPCRTGGRQAWYSAQGRRPQINYAMS